MKLSHLLLALASLGVVGEAKRYSDPGIHDSDGFVQVRGGRGWLMENPETGEQCFPGNNDATVCVCGPKQMCTRKAYGAPSGCAPNSCKIPDSDGFVQVRGGRGWLMENPETGEQCFPGNNDAPVCVCGPKQMCTRKAYGAPSGCAPNSCKPIKLRRRLSRRLKPTYYKCVWGVCKCRQDSDCGPNYACYGKRGGAHGRCLKLDCKDSRDCAYGFTCQKQFNDSGKCRPIL